MDKDKGPLTFLKKLFSKEEPSDKKPGKYQYLLLVLLFGAAIMLVGNLFFKDKTADTSMPVFNNQAGAKNEEDVAAFGKEQPEGNSIIADYERAYETQIKEILDDIVGVEDATVLVNVDATEQKVLEKNTTSKTQTTDETDREGGKRKVEDQSKEEQLVIIREGEKEVPIVLETKKPKIRGVAIVAKGAENIQVKSWIIEAVSRSLDVPTHRISVMPKKTKAKGD